MMVVNEMMVEVPLGLIIGVLLVIILVLFLNIIFLHSDKKQLQWERNHYYECYHEYMSKYVDAYQELRKLKEKEE